jgi:hypothetical protein
LVPALAHVSVQRGPTALLRFLPREGDTGSIRHLQANRARRVELDFSGVDELGRAFADELFRVWPSRHPEVRLEPTNMSPVVARVVDRARTERA